MNNKTLNIVGAFVLGLLLLHPLSMAFQGLIHPGPGINLPILFEVFNLHHLPMAVLFGLVGVVFGFLNLSYADRLQKKEQRVSQLESLLPICAYCNKVREIGKPAEDRSAWHEMEQYLSIKTETQFTHGMCPDCYDRVMDELEKMDAKEAAFG